MHEAGRLVQHRLSELPPSCAEQHLQWLFAVNRAMRSRKTSALKKAVKAIPALLNFLDPDSGMRHNQSAFQEYMAKIAAARHQKEYEEIIGHTTESPQFYEHRAARLQRLASAWSPKNRRIFLTGIADAEGNAFPTAEAGAHALAAHWSQVHASVSFQIAARDQLEEHIQKVREAQIWRLSEEQFTEFWIGFTIPPLALTGY
eukprot:543695-Pyramimonas_sp.AAC.1